jgi:hypothetical protein
LTSSFRRSLRDLRLRIHHDHRLLAIGGLHHQLVPSMLEMVPITV